MRYYSYDEFIQDVRTLASMVDGFDAYVAVARGGLTLAHFLAEAKGVRTVHTINSIGYDGTSKLDEPRVGTVPDLGNAKQVLVVDDIVDSGDTFVAVLDRLKRFYPDTSFVTAALFYKESARFKPDFFVQYADEWIDFFWTRDIDDTHDRQLR